MSKEKKIVIWICIAITVIFVGLASLYVVNQASIKKENDRIAKLAEEKLLQEAEKKVTEEPQIIQKNEAETEKEPEKEPYISPIDFDELKAINPDIYAWITITDTDISYPVLQREGDINYYLEHAYDDTYSIAGSIFSESRNAKDFSDFLTILYGHNMANGSFFGNLSYFRDEEYLENHREIVIYTPDATLTYTVFGAVIYDNRLLSVAYDYDTVEGREEFIDSFLSRPGYGCHILDDIEPTSDDHILTLSTCTGDDSTRFLVGAVLTNVEN